MLVIRKRQLDSLEDAAIRAFEDRTYAHLMNYFPGHCEIVGEEQMRRIIQHGWMKAKSYELTAECCVRSYIEFMCLLGSGFDTDPLLPWAAEILNEKIAADQVERGDRLYDRAWEYIRNVVPDYRDASGKPITARFAEELRRLRRESDQPLAANELSRFHTQLVARLQQVFPAKCHCVGDDRLKSLAAKAIETAKRHGITGARGITLVTVFMFVLGSSFDNDLLLPWASATLSDSTLTEQKKKVDRLFKEGVGVLRRWWNVPHEQEV